MQNFALEEEEEAEDGAHKLKEVRAQKQGAEGVKPVCGKVPQG